MKNNLNNPVFAKIKLFLLLLTSCITITCVFLIVIHPKAWMTPTWIIIGMIACIMLLLRFNRKKANN